MFVLIFRYKYTYIFTYHIFNTLESTISCRSRQSRSTAAETGARSRHGTAHAPSRGIERDPSPIATCRTALRAAASFLRQPYRRSRLVGKLSVCLPKDGGINLYIKNLKIFFVHNSNSKWFANAIILPLLLACQHCCTVLRSTILSISRKMRWRVRKVWLININLTTLYLKC